MRIYIEYFISCGVDELAGHRNVRIHKEICEGLLEEGANVLVWLHEENKDKNLITLGIDNVKLDFDAHNDSLLIDLSWNDDTEEDKNKGELSALFIPNGADSGKLYLSSSDMIINDTAWNISQGCYLDIKGSKLSFNNMNLYSNNQSVIVNGYFPTMSKDTLSVNFNNLDISDFDILTSGIGINIDGFINGGLQVAGIKEKISILSNLSISDIGINSLSIVIKLVLVLPTILLTEVSLSVTITTSIL